MLGVMQVKVSTIVGKENNLPGLKLLELFETVEFLKEFKSSGNPPLYLLKLSFKNRKEFDNFNKNDTLEIVDYFEVAESHAIISAKMGGPIPQIMSMFENAWPISPTYSIQNN